MIQGVVRAGREATIRLQVQGPKGQETDVEAVLDTGFTGYVTLPTAVIHSLALALQEVREAILGDGSTAFLDIYRATALWDDQPRTIQVLAAEGGSLVGMALLHGYQVTLQIVDGGTVTIVKLP
jgi:clan AA aspartic protease